MQFQGELPKTAVRLAVALLVTTLGRPGYSQPYQSESADTATPAAAATPSKPAAPHLVMAGAALANTTGGGLELDARCRWPSGVQVGTVVDGQVASHAYFGGTKAEDVAAGSVRAIALFPLLTAPVASFDLRVATGVGYARNVGGKTSPYREAMRSITELSWLAHVPLGATGLFRAGTTFTFELETKPTQALADQALLVTLGFGQKLTDATLLYATIDAGGTYGFDGDNGKVITRGAVGVRWAWDGVALGAF